jgi:hypothetical protein
VHLAARRVAAGRKDSRSGKRGNRSRGGVTGRHRRWSHWGQRLSYWLVDLRTASLAAPLPAFDDQLPLTIGAGRGLST